MRMRPKLESTRIRSLHRGPRFLSSREAPLFPHVIPRSAATRDLLLPKQIPRFARDDNQRGRYSKLTQLDTPTRIGVGARLHRIEGRTTITSRPQHALHRRIRTMRLKRLALVALIGP